MDLVGEYSEKEKEIGFIDAGWQVFSKNTLKPVSVFLSQIDQGKAQPPKKDESIDESEVPKINNSPDNELWLGYLTCCNKILTKAEVDYESSTGLIHSGHCMNPVTLYINHRGRNMLFSDQAIGAMARPPKLRPADQK